MLLKFLKKPLLITTNLKNNYRVKMNNKLQSLITEFYSCQQALYSGPAFNDDVREPLARYLETLYNNLEKNHELVIEPIHVDHSKITYRPSMYQIKGYEESKFQLKNTQIWLNIFMQKDNS